MKNSYYKLLFLFVFLAAAALSCGESKGKKPTITVSLAPLKYVVESIVGDDFHVEVIVPEGASPETYSPTPRQIAEIEKSTYVFTTGLMDFEKELIGKLSESMNYDALVELGSSVELLYGTHKHGDGGVDNGGNRAHEHEIWRANEHIDKHESGHAGEHIHGGYADPHIWMSPEALEAIASMVCMSLYYDGITEGKYLRYIDNCARLTAEIKKAAVQIQEKLSNSGREYFLIYHPALSYYARDYGLTQISLEDEGKEPSATHMKEVVRIARENDISTILYQRQFPVSVVESIAKDLDVAAVEINPLAEDILKELLYITDVITE